MIYIIGHGHYHVFEYAGKVHKRSGIPYIWWAGRRRRADKICPDYEGWTFDKEWAIKKGTEEEK